MKRSTFGEVDRVRRPQGLELHDILIEPLCSLGSPAQREVEFEVWFAWPNDLLRELKGFGAVDCAANGTYTALVEHQKC